MFIQGAMRHQDDTAAQRFSSRARGSNNRFASPAWSVASKRFWVLRILRAMKARNFHRSASRMHADRNFFGAEEAIANVV